MKKLWLFVLSLTIVSFLGCDIDSSKNMSADEHVVSDATFASTNKENTSKTVNNSLAENTDTMQLISEAEDEAVLLDSHVDEKGAVLASGNYGSEGDNVQFKLFENGNMYFYGSGDMKVFNNKAPFEEYSSDIKRVRIEKGITGIGQSTFSDCSVLQEIIIPDSVTIIRKNAFYKCRSLQSVDIPDSVTDIADQSFYECISLESVKLSSNLKSIPFGCFSTCSVLKEINIPQSVASIGGMAFSDCISIEEIIIPEKITQIQDSTFYGCSSIREMRIPASVTDIGYCAFSGCNSMRDVYFLGDKPRFGSGTVFTDYVSDLEETYDGRAKLNIHYPDGNATWDNISEELEYGKFHGAEVTFVKE